MAAMVFCLMEVVPLRFIVTDLFECEAGRSLYSVREILDSIDRIRKILIAR